MSSVLPAIVLVRPTEQGNIGAVARAMANMGLRELVLVEPAAPIGDTARAFAVTAAPILDSIRRAPSFHEALAPYARIVGTTSARARDIDAAPAVDATTLQPRELPERLAADPDGTPTALVFGPERSGLTNEELARCEPWVTVPCAPELPTLNLSQAVLIVAYELYLARVAAAWPAPATPRLAVPGVSDPSRAAPATAVDVEALFEQAGEALRAIGYARDTTFVRVQRDLRRLLGRAAPSPREVTLLRGICRRAMGRLGADKAP